MDLVGPLKRISKGNEYIITLLDLATRYVHCVAVRKIAVKVASSLDVACPLPRANKGNEYIVTLLNLTTRYVHSLAVGKISVKLVCWVLCDILLGLSVKLQANGASYFVGRKFQLFSSPIVSHTMFLVHRQLNVVTEPLKQP